MMDQSCRTFTERLSSREPVPGGGGATALVGACAAALLSMVGNYTTGKKKYADVEADIQRLLDRGDELRVRLLSLAGEDAENFEPLSRAYALPKDAPDRAAVLEAATKKACEAPFAMMEVLCELIDLLSEMAEKGSRMLLSDVGCGALFARAALEGAALNVLVNTGQFSGEVWAIELDTRAHEMLATYLPVANDVAQRVNEQIGG